jgi:hypothetical protein
MEVMSHCQLSDESPCRDSSGVTVLASAEPLLKTYYKDSDLWKVLGANGHSITFAGEEATRVSKYRCSMMPASILHRFNQPPPACLPQRAVRPCRRPPAAAAGGEAEQTEETTQPPPLPAAGRAAKGTLEQKQR